MSQMNRAKYSAGLVDTTANYSQKGRLDTAQYDRHIMIIIYKGV